MFSVTVLSPHRDDAAFSLALSLECWSALGASISIINFFTRSSYAPRVPPSSPDTVSSIRKREDRISLGHIAPGARVIDMGLLDAPLRLSIDFGQVCSPEAQRRIRAEDMRSVAMRIEKIAAAELALVPLALGNHVDHIVVNRAALEKNRPQRFAYYEDLPYATWTPDPLIESRVREIERATFTELQPLAISIPNAVWRKQRFVARYQSQITVSEAKSIAAFARRYRGERIWCPAHGKPWKSMVRYASTA